MEKVRKKIKIIKVKKQKIQNATKIQLRKAKNNGWKN